MVEVLRDAFTNKHLEVTFRAWIRERDWRLWKKKKKKEKKKKERKDREREREIGKNYI